MVKAVQGIVTVTAALTMVALLATASRAQYNDAARAYQKGDYGAAFGEYRALAEAGDVRAQANLGWMYQTGQGTALDPAQAVAWYARAAEHGHEIAQYNLGYAYEKGEGAPRDLVQAARWYAKAAKQGNAEAKAGSERVQKLLATGAVSAAKSPAGKKKGASLTRSKKPDAPPVLARVHSGEHRVNPKMVRTRLAAEAGDLDATVYLGWCYSSGHDVPPNKTEAMVWYRLAAAKGSVDAQLALGWMNYIGEGSRRDLSEAADWYQLAANQGSRKAKRMLRKIERESRLVGGGAS